MERLHNREQEVGGKVCRIVGEAEEKGDTFVGADKGGGEAEWRWTSKSWRTAVGQKD